MIKLDNIFREITPLSPEDSFLVLDRVKEPYNFPYHYHPEIEINFIDKGSGYKRMVGDHTGETDYYELVLVGPNLPHCWMNYRETTKKIHEITIQFNQDFFNQAMMKKNVFKTIELLIKESHRGILFSQETAAKLRDSLLNLSKLNSFDSYIEIMKILNVLATSEGRKPLSSSSIDTNLFEENDSMKKLHNYLHVNYDKKITIDFAVSYLNMTYITFNRFIKKKTGKPFVNYLNEIRIGYASRWLLEKELTVAEIAFKSGFNNLANFNKIFKSIKGSTPTEYKEQFLGVRKIE